MKSLGKIMAATALVLSFGTGAAYADGCSGRDHTTETVLGAGAGALTGGLIGGGYVRVHQGCAGLVSRGAENGGTVLRRQQGREQQKQGKYSCNHGDHFLLPGLFCLPKGKGVPRA